MRKKNCKQLTAWIALSISMFSLSGVASANPSSTTEEWAKHRPSESVVLENMKEFEKDTIADIKIDGISKEDADKAKAVMKLKAGEKLDTGSLNKDREAVYGIGLFRDLYPTAEKTAKGIVITYHILENPAVNKIVLSGNTVEKTDELAKDIHIKKGKAVSSDDLQKITQAIQDRYRKDGYVLAKVTELSLDDKNNLIVKINEGKLEGYTVKGNKKTKDKVILREMRQKAGEPFNVKEAKRSIQRVTNLGFFDDVNAKMTPGVSPNATVMEINVKEHRTGSVGIGAGYSSEDGIIGSLNFSDTNLRGTGDSIGVNYQVSKKDTDTKGYGLSYTHPYIDAKGTSGSLKLYNQEHEYSDYDTNGHLIEEYMRKFTGGELTFSRPTTEYSMDSITLKNRKDNYLRHDEDESGFNRSGSVSYPNLTAKQADEWRKYNFGTTRSITLSHVTDTRDNALHPTGGKKVEISGEVAGFGGDFNYQKVSIADDRYVKVGHAQTIVVHNEAGAAHGHIPEYSQFSVGGQDSLRGYREDQFRGNKMILSSIEYRFPLFEKTTGAVFTDWGAAWGFHGPNGNPYLIDKSKAQKFHLKGDIGAGLSFDSPIGPLRLDYGYGTDGGRMNFRVGNSF